MALTAGEIFTADVVYLFDTLEFNDWIHGKDLPYMGGGPWRLLLFEEDDDEEDLVAV